MTLFYPQKCWSKPGWRHDGSIGTIGALAAGRPHDIPGYVEVNVLAHSHMGVVHPYMILYIYILYIYIYIYIYILYINIYRNITGISGWWYIRNHSKSFALSEHPNDGLVLCGPSVSSSTWKCSSHRDNSSGLLMDDDIDSLLSMSSGSDAFKQKKRSRGTHIHTYNIYIY